jgi:hypothetical protein
MDTAFPGYSHTQKAPLCLIVYGTAIVMIAGAWCAHAEGPITLILAASGIVMALLASAFHHLTIVDQGEGLAIRFGPVPVFNRTVRYADIVKVEIGRTLILDGWGIHLSVRGGWVCNIWSRACVVLHLRKGILRVGTDDGADLARFLEGKIVRQGT